MRTWTILGRGVGLLGLMVALTAPVFSQEKGTDPGQQSDPTRSQTRSVDQGARRNRGSRNAAPDQGAQNGQLRAVPAGQGGAPGATPPAGQGGAPGATPPAGQGGAPGATPPAGQGGPAPSMSPGGMITMDFRGSDISNVLKFFAMAAGWQVVPDASLTGPVTIISPKPLTLDQAFQVLQSTLEVRGFSGQLEKRGQVQILKIVPLATAVQSGTLIRTGTNLTPDDLKNQVVTQVIPIENVDASTLSRELKELTNKGASLVASSGTNALIVTDTASNVQRIVDLVAVLDKAASNTDIRIFALKHADATDVANAITNLFRQLLSRGRTNGIGGGQPGMPPGVVMGPNGQPMPAAAVGGAAPDRAAIIATPDTRTNSVLVVASADNMKRAEEIINKLDDAQSAALQTKLFKLQFTDSDSAADTINSVLSGTTPPGQTRSGGFGGGGAGFFQRVFGGGGGGSTQGVQSTNAFAKVVSNARTNSLIATATDEWMSRIEALVKELDVPVKTETTTFVIPLKNAQAGDLASVLGQAFGTTTSGGGYSSYNPFGNLFGGSNNRQSANRQPINRRNTGTSTFGRSVSLPGASTPAAPIHGTLTPTGFVPDPNEATAATDGDPITRQFVFGGGQMFGRGGQQTSTPQYGRGRQGQYVNLLQLRQNVSVVPDLGSNSLVITTTPDNLAAIREIVDSLDIIPRQVMIEVIIAEATLSSAQKLGFQFDSKGIGKLFNTDITQSGASSFPLGTAGSTSSNIASPIQPGVQYGVQAVNGRFNALIQALNTDSKVRVLSTPKVFTSNNQEATINIVTHVPYATGSTIGGLNLGTTVNYSYLDLGVTLDVTPRITSDGRVTIDVTATTSDLVGFDTVQASVDASGRVTNTPAPRWSERSTDTSVSVKDGEIVALGGMMRENTNISANKVPILGDIPLLGSLFRSTSRSVDKTELMIFMVPHVVDADRLNRDMLEKQTEQIRKDFPQLEKHYPYLAPQNPPTKGKPAKPAGQPTGASDAPPTTTGDGGGAVKP